MTDKRVFKFHIVLVAPDGTEYPVESQRLCTRWRADCVVSDLSKWVSDLGLTVGCATAEDIGPGVICNHAALCIVEPLTACEHSQPHVPGCEFYDGARCTEVPDGPSPVA